MPKNQIDEQLKARILKGRKAVDAYRDAHIQLHSKPWHKGVPGKHTILFKKLIAELEKIGITSTKTDFEPKKTEILANFFEDSEDLNIQETGILEGKIRANREDLSLIGFSPDMSPPIIVKNNNVELKLVEGRWGKEVELYINNRIAMQTHPGMHASMEKSVEQCPINARAYIGGLGLGLILLYLAFSGKAVEVIVCEKNENLIRLLANKVIQWFAVNYPGFRITIIKGMAWEEIGKHGKFDWIFYDFLSLTHLANAKLCLTVDGILTDRHDFLYSKDPRWWH